MLKVVVFKNFVHFKKRTVISLDASKRSKAGNSNVGEKPTGINFLNIFVGANFSGKSTVLELIRRCMTEKKNASETNSCDEDHISYAFCEFDLAPYDQIISGILKKPNSSVVYRILAFTKTVENKKENKVYTSPDFTNFYSCKSSVIDDISAILNQEDDNASENKLLQHIENECINNDNKESYKDIKPIWDSLENKYVATFPLRGIGSLQWSNSKNILNRDDNYRAAYERAEIISDLLSEEQNQFIRADEEKRIFKILTDSEDFEFKKKENTIEVKHNGKPFPLLKISEGIFEAKSTSLLLAHTQFQTLCLEDPDRGMHPQMIERLRSVLLESGLEKTIIVVTHSPYFIDSTTIDNTHMFFRTKDEFSVCSVLNIGQSEELSKVADIEIKRTVLFATRVLLVEGATDKEVVQGILTENKESKEDSTKFYISIHQIISVGGKNNAARVQRFCNYINLPCLSLLDLDAAVKFEIEPLKTFTGFDDSLREMYRKTLVKTKKEFWQFLEKLESQLRVFIWRDGALEDAILSSESCKEEIESALGRRLNPDSLKTILKEPIDGNKRKAFYTALMKVDEIKRFIKFIEDNTSTSKPMVAGVDI